MSEYVKQAKDFAVVKEYNDLCRCFTEEQLESLREIQ